MTNGVEIRTITDEVIREHIRNMLGRIPRSIAKCAPQSRGIAVKVEGENNPTVGIRDAERPT